mgnify:CR=1 FL=1
MENWQTIVSIITTIVIVVYLAKTFVSKSCDHRFNADEVHDLNSDPRCTRCKKFFSKINSESRVRFERIDDKEYKLIKR